MKHGLVVTETYVGAKLMVPPSITYYNRIGLPIQKKYRFTGYKTSILRYMLDNQTIDIEGKNSLGFTLHVSCANVMEKAAKAYSKQIGGFALGGAGEVVQMVGTMNSVLDGISVAGMIADLAPNGKTPKLKRPGRAAYMKDHALNSRIMVEIGLQKGKIGWTDLGETECTMLDVARVVNAF